MMRVKQKSNINLSYLFSGMVLLIVLIGVGCSKSYLLVLSGKITHFNIDDEYRLEVLSPKAKIWYDTIIIGPNGTFEIEIKYRNYTEDSYLKVFRGPSLMASFALEARGLSEQGNESAYFLRDSISSNEYSVRWDGKRFFADSIIMGLP
jgi:hypothetical protein